MLYGMFVKHRATHILQVLQAIGPGPYFNRNPFDLSQNVLDVASQMQFKTLLESPVEPIGN